MKTSAPLRLGVLGLTHDHVWSNLQELRRVKGVTLVAAADPHTPLLERVKKETGCATYPDFDRMIERESLDAVYIFADNATGAALGVKAARRGWHVLVEKPMAANLTGADKLLEAVRIAGVRLMVNWPFAWWPPLQHALHLVEQGAIGRVWQTRYRAAHAGPREMGCSAAFSEWLYNPALNGGGALIDYCCYGALLARVLLGVPSRVTGVKGRVCKEDLRAEDNALLVMSYPQGLALAEASWTQIGHLTSYVTAIYGTTGTLLVEPGERGRLLLATADKPDGTVVKVPPSPAHLLSASAHFVHALKSGRPFHPLCQDRMARDAQEILEAGLTAADSGADSSLPLRQ
jgi:predicted dehydrogenase